MVYMRVKTISTYSKKRRNKEKLKKKEMKKTFYLIVLMSSLFQTQATAQNFSSDGWWGYYETGQPRWDLGSGEAETYGGAIFVPGNVEGLKGMFIDKVRLYLRNTQYMEDLSVWVSTKTPPRAAKANVLYQPIDISTIVGGNESLLIEGERKDGIMNEITLSTPCEIPSKGVYVGYSFTITYVGGDYDYDNAYPLVCAYDVPSVSGGCMMFLSQTFHDWYNAMVFFENCNLCTQIHLISPDDVNTAILSTQCDETPSRQNIYDLQGRLISNSSSSITNHPSPQKGIYIKDGKKYLVK